MDLIVASYQIHLVYLIAAIYSDPKSKCRPSSRPLDIRVHEDTPPPESIANGGVLVLAAVVLVLAVAAADDTQPLETDVLRSHGAVQLEDVRLQGTAPLPGLCSIRLAINNLTGAPDLSKLPGQVLLQGRYLMARPQCSHFFGYFGSTGFLMVLGQCYSELINIVNG
jgi:hypothetical protein